MGPGSRNTREIPCFLVYHEGASRGCSLAVSLAQGVVPVGLVSTVAAVAAQVGPWWGAVTTSAVGPSPQGGCDPSRRCWCTRRDRGSSLAACSADARLAILAQGVGPVGLVSTVAAVAAQVGP